MICIQKHIAWQCHNKACITVFVACEREYKPVQKKKKKKKSVGAKKSWFPTWRDEPQQVVSSLRFLSPEVAFISEMKEQVFGDVQRCSRLGDDHRFILFPSPTMGRRDGRSSGQAAWMVLDSGKWMTFIYIYWWGNQEPSPPKLDDTDYKIVYGRSCYYDLFLKTCMGSRVLSLTDLVSLIPGWKMFFLWDNILCFWRFESLNSTKCCKTYYLLEFLLY